MLSRKEKLSIYRSMYAPTLTYGHELWVMTGRTRSRIQATEIGFLRRVAWRSRRDRVRSSVTEEELEVEPPRRAGGSAQGKGSLGVPAQTAGPG